MKGKLYATEDKIRLLRDADGGKDIVEVCKEKNTSMVSPSSEEAVRSTAAAVAGHCAINHSTACSRDHRRDAGKRIVFDGDRLTPHRGPALWLAVRAVPSSHANCLPIRPTRRTPKWTPKELRSVVWGSER